MKVILLFALCCLSFCQALITGTDEKTDCSTPGAYANDEDCLKKAFANSADFVFAVGNFICQKKGAEAGENNVEAYKDSAAKLVNVTRCVGCRADQYFGQGKTFETVLTEITKATTGVGENVVKIVDALKLDALTLDALCILTGKFLQSDCVKKALESLTPELIQDLKDLYCLAQKDKAEEAAKKLAEILVKLACGLDEQLATKDLLEPLVKNIGKALVPIIKEILLLAKIPIGNIVCLLLDPTSKIPTLPVLANFGG